MPSLGDGTRPPINLSRVTEAIDLETLRNVHEVHLGDVELNAIEEAVAERAEKDKRTREGEGE